MVLPSFKSTVNVACSDFVEVVAVGDADGNDDSNGNCNTTTSSEKKRMTKKKASKQKDQQPSHFKPEYSDVFNFIESDKFSFWSISTTVFENNILCAGVKSKLRGLDMGGPEQFVFAQHLTVHMLQKVASKMGLTSHNVAKPMIAEMIINKVGELEEKVAKAKENGEDIDVSTIALVDEKGHAVAINTPRFLNVLFSEKIIPLLANRGANLTKDGRIGRRLIKSYLSL